MLGTRPALATGMKSAPTSSAVAGAGADRLVEREWTVGGKNGGKNDRGGDENLTVDDAMTPAPTCCSPDSPLHDAAKLLWECDIGVLPVVNGASHGQVCAMITDRDIAMAAYTQARPLHELRVRSACSGPARSCRPSDDLAKALETMAEAAVRRLVVVDADNRPVGVLSLSDIARQASRPGRRCKQLERAACRALAAITSRSDRNIP